MKGAGDAGPGVAADVGEAEVEAAACAMSRLREPKSDPYEDAHDVQFDPIRVRRTVRWRLFEAHAREILAAAYAARSASFPQDGGEALREARAEIPNLQGKLAASEAAERERDEAHHRGYLAAINDMRKAATAFADASVERALAAALDPPPRGATGPSGTRDGQGEAADGGEGGGGAAHDQL